MTLGITVGKLYPFHLGHDHLIRTARAQVGHLVVLVGAAPDQHIPGSVRAGWIRALHPEVEGWPRLCKRSIRSWRSPG
jgi:HTH-type transcriptional repressor of NAD biosynthesis genes